MIGEQQDLDSRVWVVRLDLIVWGVFSWCEKRKISDFLLMYGCMIWVDSCYKNTSGMRDSLYCLSLKRKFLNGAPALLELRLEFKVEKREDEGEWRRRGENAVWARNDRIVIIDIKSLNIVIQEITRWSCDAGIVSKYYWIWLIWCIFKRKVWQMLRSGCWEDQKPSIHKAAWTKLRSTCYTE